MDWWQVVVLAVIQGVTEFLPISSSAHLILPAQLLGWADQGLAFDVAVHVGTLVAVMLYFRQRLAQLSVAGVRLLQTRRCSSDARLLIQVAVAVLPAAVIGCMFEDLIESQMRSVRVIATTTIGFGVLLGVADYLGGGRKTLSDITWKVALLIGIAQAFALIPGTSRSGVTITAALLLGYSRQSSAEFSFLLSIPIILAAGSLKGLELYIDELRVDWLQMMIATALASGSAYGCIKGFMRLLDRVGMWPFVGYRLLLGIWLLL